jgi:hypothetical protein
MRQCASDFSEPRLVQDRARMTLQDKFSRLERLVFGD